MKLIFEGTAKEISDLVTLLQDRTSLENDIINCLASGLQKAQALPYQH